MLGNAMGSAKKSIYFMELEPVFHALIHESDNLIQGAGTDIPEVKAG